MATVQAPRVRWRNDRVFYTGASLYLAILTLAGFARGRLHEVWIWVGAAVLVSQIGKVFISQTEPWTAFARAVAALWSV
jgi:hypothetical protein